MARCSAAAARAASAHGAARRTAHRCAAARPAAAPAAVPCAATPARLGGCGAQRRHVARRCAADDAARDSDADAVGLGDLIELQLGGFCCVPDGFLALLVPRGAALAPAPNAVERLRGAAPAAPPPPPGAPAAALALRMTADAADADAPSTVAALTLLQLAQSPPIDMGGALFPYDALARLTAHEEALLGAVIIAEPGAAAVSGAGGGAAPQPASAAAFEATLLAGGADAPGAFATGDAWLAVAFALRYAPYGARLFAAPGAMASAGLPLAEVASRFPATVAAADVAAQGSAVAETLRRAYAAAARDSDAPPPGARGA